MDYRYYIELKPSNLSEVMLTFKNHASEIYSLIDVKYTYIYRRCFLPNIYLIVVNNKPAGFINIDFPTCGKLWYIDIWISPEFRGKGIAKYVLSKYLDQLVKQISRAYKVKSSQVCMIATIDNTNTPSVKLFKSLGFSELNSSTKNKNLIKLKKCFKIN